MLNETENIAEDTKGPAEKPEAPAEQPEAPAEQPKEPVEQPKEPVEQPKPKDKPQGKTPHQVLYIHQYDANSSTSKQKQILQLSPTQTLKGKTLKEVRKILNDSGVLGSKDVKSPFCEASGSRVSDDMKVELYLGLVGIDSVDAGKLDVYFKAKRIFGKVDPATEEFIKQKLDLTFKNPPEVIEKEPQLLTSLFEPSDWKAVKGTLSHAADLDEKEWSVIIRGNCLLSGHFTINDEKGQAKKVVRSAYNAFTLQPRKFDGYEISNSDFVNQKEPSTDTPFEFRIPRFRVNDDSSVTVVEAKTAFEKTVADSSFKEGSFQIAGSASYAGISAGLSVGGAGGTSTIDHDATKTSKGEIKVNYNYPRITLYWDPESLEVTPSCLEDIERVKDRTSLMAFFAKYGHSFARRVQLGGRLSTSEVIEKDAKDEIKEQASKLKAEVAASVSHSFVQASLKYSHENQSREVNTTTNQNLTSNIAWEANGGNTLLCNNPAEWCATVGLYSNWRIVEQDHVVPIEDFLAECPHVDEGIIERFRLSAQDKFAPKDEVPPTPSPPTPKPPTPNPPTPSPPQPPPKPVVRRRQVFELCEPDANIYLGVVDSADPVLHFIRDWSLWKLYPSVVAKACEQHIRDAHASLSTLPRISSKQTEFMVWEPYVEVQREELTYHKEYFVKAKAHAHEYFLDFVAGLPHEIDIIHLSESTGVRFQFKNVTSPDKKGYVQEGDIVYLCVGDKPIRPMARGVVTLGWEPTQTSTEPWKLKYHAKGIDSR